ncbi:uncharacterized protein LOC108622545 [Ceratina calcarata]|uniref:Uncharacterized protein LOC108622545 n=1 Tax=Ceratina calcarata TaxID=156304 RepID=A0AAJ7N3M0_9HYME|nr:uncharacterized protein LOC108622545 [Ceratina calcarata]
MVGDSPDIVGEGPISDLGDLEGWWSNHGIAAWSFALFGCFLLNVTLLLAFLIRPSLRTLSNRFVMNLTVSNLLVCAIMNPLLIMDSTSRLSNGSTAESPFIRSICATSEAAVAIVTTSSVLSVLLIGIDQYFAVVDPLRYRARVDKMKSGILIGSIWFISLIFGFLAFFNPNPQSFWLTCIPRNASWSVSNGSFDTFVESTIVPVLEDEASEQNQLKPNVIETIDESGRSASGDVDLVGNNTVIFDTLISGTVTYGFVYAVAYAVFAYLIPFVAVCWIYVSIYVAAHRNSERARRSGSRPVLSSSASFTEEHIASSRLQRFQAETVDDFRKLPKISSLSSIDETSETIQPAGQLSRRRSFSSSLELGMGAASGEGKTSSGIVFTVGLKRLEVCHSVENEEDPTGDRSYENNCDIDEDADEIKNRRRDSQQTEESTEQEKQAPIGWISGTFIDGSSDSEDEGFECFDNLQNDLKQFDPSSVYPVDLLNESLKISKVDVETGVNNESVIRPVEIGDDEEREGRLLEVETARPDLRTLTVVPSEPRSSRRSSLKTTNGSSGACEISCNKTENNSGTDSSACLLAPIVTITPAPSKHENLHRVSSVRSTSSYINSLKDRISNGSIFRHREEARAARISALVIVMGLICWSPYVILLVMKNLPRSTDQHLPHKYDVLASGLLILAAYISPLLFGYRSKRVKRELRRFFCFRKELSYKNNRSLMAKKVLKRRHSSTLSNFEMEHKHNIFNCMYGRPRWPKEKVQFVQVPDTALAVETCRSSFSSGASTQISSTSTEEC